MGGSGSGNRHHRPARKPIVEDARSFGVEVFRGRIWNGSTGTITWTAWRTGPWPANYYVYIGFGMAILSLDYHLADGEGVRLLIDLQTTPLHFGGTRWWFTCPLRRNEIPCNRRCGKLYLYPE